MISFGISMERFIFSESTLCKQLMQIDLSAASAYLRHGEWPLILTYWGGYTNINYKQQLWCTWLPIRAQCIRPALWSLRREKGRSTFILGWLSWLTSLRADLMRRSWSMGDAACGAFVEIPSLQAVPSIYVEEWGHREAFKPLFSFQWLKIDHFSSEEDDLKPDSPLQGGPLIFE